MTTIVLSIFSLLCVFNITTSSSMISRRLLYYFILFIFSCISLTADGYPHITLDSSTLKTANLFFRHGARTPLVATPHNAKIDPVVWKEEPGILTKVGKEKLFELGLVLRNMYHDFLSPQYVPEEILVTTTDMERTLNSARALLAGLYNPDRYVRWNDHIPLTSVPIFTDHNVIDKSNIINAPNACPLFRADQRWAVEKARAEDKGFEDVYNYLSLFAGSKIEGMYDIFPLWDVLECLAHNKRKLPDWASFVYPKQMALITAKVLRSLITGTKRMIRLAGGPYMKEVHNQFKAAEIDLPSVKKLVIHGGHDFSMTANLGTYGILEKIVNPGDALIIELHQVPFAGYFVQLLYAEAGGSVISSLPIKDCGQPCPLHKFYQLTYDAIPNNWDTECMIRK